MPMDVIKRHKRLGKISYKKEHRSKLEFLDCLKCLYNWDNEELNDMEETIESEILHMFPNIPVEILGVELETYREKDGVTADLL